MRGRGSEVPVMLYRKICRILDPGDNHDPQNTYSESQPYYSVPLTLLLLSCMLHHSNHLRFLSRDIMTTTHDRHNRCIDSITTRQNIMASCILSRGVIQYTARQILGPLFEKQHWPLNHTTKIVKLFIRSISEEWLLVSG